MYEQNLCYQGFFLVHPGSQDQASTALWHLVKDHFVSKSGINRCRQVWVDTTGFLYIVYNTEPHVFCFCLIPGSPQHDNSDQNLNDRFIP